ncbi:MAG: ExeA family protein [Gammaproteobacteria bacterium]|nr:ExeA family protein [Gammaproteobacteria bacterium]MCP5443358.1 ExeA family protein [Chromatiaceae bacterium]
MLSHKAKKHFRLFQDPFVDDVQNTDDLFLSEEHRYIRETMFYAARQGRFIAIVGESGSGKSTLRRDLLDRIGRERHPISVIQPRTIDKGRLSAGAICDAIIDDLGEPRPKRSLEAKARQIEQLLTGSSRAGNNHVLIIEEAHDLNVQVLKQLKRFWELEDGYKHLLGIILIGQPELQRKLDERTNWQAREVIRRCEVALLEPIDSNLKEYLLLKFNRISKPIQEVFSDDVYDAIRKKLTLHRRGSQQVVSMLYPLNINNVVRRAMNLAADLGVPKVTAEIVREI